MMPLNTPTIGTAVALGIVIVTYRLLGKNNERVPPGPPRYPIIGNVLNFPMQGWAKFSLDGTRSTVRINSSPQRGFSLNPFYS